MILGGQCRHRPSAVMTRCVIKRNPNRPVPRERHLLKGYEVVIEEWKSVIKLLFIASEAVEHPELRGVTPHEFVTGDACKGACQTSLSPTSQPLDARVFPVLATLRAGSRMCAC